MRLILGCIPRYVIHWKGLSLQALSAILSDLSGCSAAEELYWAHTLVVSHNFTALFNRAVADLERDCPPECLDMIYTFSSDSGDTRGSPNTPDQAFIAYRYIGTVVLARLQTPFMSVLSVPQMVDIQFVCNVAALLGMWFGVTLVDGAKWVAHVLLAKIYYKLEPYLTKWRPRRESSSTASVVNLVVQPVVLSLSSTQNAANLWHHQRLTFINQK